MPDRHSIKLYSRERMRKAREGLDFVDSHLDDGWQMVLTRKRSDVQNNLLWKWLGIISKQLLWHGQYYPPESWKDNFMHALAGSQFMPGLDGGMVPIGKSTSALGVSEFRLLMGSIDAFAAREGIELPKPEDRDSARIPP